MRRLERMRVFKGERGRVVLRLKLPQFDGEAYEEFNDLYSKLILEYTRLCERLQQNASGDELVEVSFSEEKPSLKRVRRGENLIIIKRLLRCKRDGGETLKSHTDIYDTQNKIFLK